MANFKGLGTIQFDIMRALDDHGPWHDRAGWNWSTPTKTRRHMEALAKRGLVDKGVKTVKGKFRSFDIDTYTLNDAGRSAIDL